MTDVFCINESILSLSLMHLHSYILFKRFIHLLLSNYESFLLHIVFLLSAHTRAFNLIVYIFNEK